MIKEIPFIHLQKEGIDYYGGTQDWYDKKFHRLAGCAAILASNLYYCYRGEFNVDYQDYRKMMDTMFQLNKPGFIGFPYFYKFSHNFVHFMSQQGITLKPVYQKKRTSVEDGYRFVKKHINASRPIGLLVLTHQAKEIEEETWHWMCITGYDDIKKEVILSSMGKRITMKRDILFQQDHRNVVKMLTFIKK